MLFKVQDDGSYHPIEVVRFPECALFYPEIVDGNIVVKYQIPDEPLFPPTPEQKTTLEIPLNPDTSDLAPCEVNLYNSSTTSYRMGEAYDSWFSSCFGFETVLVFVGDGKRPVLGTMSPHVGKQSSKGGWLSSVTSYVTGAGTAPEMDPHWLTFACVAPFLITSEASLKDVSSRLPPGEEMDMRKFRSNIVVDGDEMWDEDFWGEIAIDSEDGNRHKFSLTANCGRCVSINVDLSTGRPGKGENGAVLKKLMKDRRVDKGNKWSPVFGRYAFLLDEQADVSVGDEVVVTKKSDERSVWDWPMH